MGRQGEGRAVGPTMGFEGLSLSSGVRGETVTWEGDKIDDK